MRVSASSLAGALALANDIAGEYHLSQLWLTQENEDIACLYTAAQR
jgi:hypothetical protein